VKRLFVVIALAFIALDSFGQAPPVTQLTSGVSATISGDQNSTLYAIITVPPNTPVLQVTTRGGTGDVDLSITSPDGITSGSARDGTTETLSFANPTPGQWQIQALGYVAYSGVSLTASLITPAPLNPNSILSGLSATISSESFYRIPVPAGAVALNITSSGGTGDVDLYLRQGAPATCQPNVQGSCLSDVMSENEGNQEIIIINSPAPGDWYLDLVAYDTYADLTVNISTAVPALKVSSGGSLTAITPGTGNVLNAGYATASLSAGSAPFATAVYSFSQNGAVVSEAGIPASPPTTSSRIFIDYRTGVASGVGTLTIRTGVAIANPNATSADFAFTLRDTSGQTLATGHGTLPAGAHRARFIDELNLLASDFSLPTNFSTAIRYGSLEITSSQAISVVALRLTTNQRGETILTSTPIADLTHPQTSAPLFFSQMANGGGFTTSVVLINTSTVTENGTIALFSDSGAPVVVQQAGGASGSIFPFSIPASGSFVFQTDGSPASTQVGWIRVTPNPGGTTPVGAGIFSYSPQGILITESGVPSAAPTTKARLYIDKSNGHDTGIALVNTGAAAGTLTMTAFQTDGVTAAGDGPATLNITAGGYRAAFAGQLISGLPSGFKGVAEISSTSPFAALTLRALTNSRNETLLTTFPVADANQPAPAPIVFPQIADGSGFTTQFIFISANGSASVNVNFTGDDGKPLPIGLGQ
jgi:hypothetical protein